MCASSWARKVYETMIPRNVRISEAPSYGKPVLVYDLKCVGSEAYLRLATEIIQRERALKAAGKSLSSRASKARPGTHTPQLACADAVFSSRSLPARPGNP